MILYFADRHMNILGQASTELPKGLYVSDDLKTEEVEAGVATLEFTLNYTDDTRRDATQYSTVGNYILRKNGDEQEFYTIITSEENIFKQEVEIYAEDAGMDLLNETVGEYKADKAYPASYYVEKFSDDSGFEVGINEVSNYNRKLSWEGETTASERILSVATQFDAEVSYTFEIDRLKIKHKYINLHKKRGVDQGRELRINREVKNIIVKSSVEDLATALSVTGGYPEDSETPINLKGYKYDDGDIYLSGSTIYSRSAVAKWSRYLSEKGNGTGHIVQAYTYDTLSQSELCNRAVSKLKKIYDAAVSYEVELAYLPDGIKIGDTENIVDDAGELYLSARIMKLESSICNDEYTATLGEYKLKASGISEKMENLAAQFEKLAKNRTFYTWVVFADTETGAGISLKSAGKAYMGIAYNQTTKQPVLTDPSVYTWVKVVGDQGIAGEPGKDGLTSFFHVMYADVPNPTANQMRKDTGKYIGTYTDYMLEDSTEPTKYTWQKFQGDDGEDGADGIPGNDGADGETSYLHMAYATSSDGKTGFSTTDAVDKTYIGQYVDFEKADSTDPTKYRWSKFQGPKGDKGEKGAQGLQGDTGPTGSMALQTKVNFSGTYTIVGQTAVAGIRDFNRIPAVGDAFICMDGSSNTGTWLVTAVSESTVTIRLLAYVNSKGATGDKGDKGDTGATGPQGPQGVKGESDIKCYQLVGGSNELVWSKLGTLTSAGDNSNFIVNIYTGNGYNGGSNQNSQAEIVIKDGWQAAASTTSAFGVSVTRQNCDNLQVQVRATASNKCDVWVYLPWSYSWGTYTISGKYTSWETSSTVQTAEPAIGTLQDLNYRMNAENASKTATNFVEFVSGIGLLIGNKISGAWSGYRTKITSSSFEILNQAGETLASYGEKLIQLGKNAADAVIELCGGKGKIKHTNLWTYGGTDPTLSIESQNAAVLAEDKALVRVQHNKDGYRHATQLFMKEKEIRLGIYKGNVSDSEEVDDYTAGMLIDPDKGIFFECYGATDTPALENLTLNLTTLSKLIYPVGSIYMSTNSTDPKYLFGGTWEQWGVGRVPVGVDASDSDFNAAGKTGGTKTVNLEHAHTESVGTDESSMYLVGNGGLWGSGVQSVSRMTWKGTTSTGLARLNSTSRSGSKLQSIMQPYITCYMWKRTS